jgi:antitoxin MazE
MVAEQIVLQQGTEIEMSVGERTITLIPLRKKPTLDELLAKITPENHHAEIVFGTEGNELI